MANGIMTGTGTSADPYLIEDVYDFCAIGTYSDGTDKYFRLTKSIDFNDHPTYHAGISSAIFNAQHSYLNSEHNYSIKNIVARSCAFFLSSVQNIRFTNLSSKITSYVAAVSANQFTNCEFSNILDHAKFASVAGNGNKYTECTFNITGTTDIVSISSATLKRCQINLKNLISTDGYFDSWLDNNSEQVYTTGKINYTGDTPASMFAGTVKLKNSYVAVETAGNIKTDVLSASGITASGDSFIDVEIARVPTTATGAGNTHLLTTAQCNIAAGGTAATEYLSDLGFITFGEA